MRKWYNDGMNKYISTLLTVLLAVYLLPVNRIAHAKKDLWLWDMNSNRGTPVSAGTAMHVSKIEDGYGNSKVCLVDWEKHQAWVTCTFLSFSLTRSP